MSFKRIFTPKSAVQRKQLSMLTTFLLFYTDEDFAETFNPKMIPSLKVSSSFLNMEMNTSEKEMKKINVSDIQLSSPKLDHPMKSLDTLDMKNVVSPVNFLILFSSKVFSLTKMCSTFLFPQLL